MYRAQGNATGTRGRTQKSANPKSDFKVLVAVDFGTTFSAVAYANTADPGSQNTVDDWGSGPQGESVPSVLKYENDDIKQSFEWGFQALNQPPGVKRHEWFKLGLDPDLRSRAEASELMVAYPSTTALPPVKPRHCEKLVGDYLRSLKAATDSYFTRALTKRILGSPREYIITVPAMWSEAAQEATRSCAAEAFLGNRHEIDKIQIVAEPEAAGVYALTGMPTLGLGEGDTFVICDAGGGTVDLSSYRIKSLSPSHIDLEGCAVPSGGLCGSSFLNRIFYDYLLNVKLKGYIEPHNTTHMRWLKAAVDRDFENLIKPGFKGVKDDEMHFIDALCFEDESPRHGVRNNMVELTDKEIRKNVFDVVVSRIRTLVSRQIVNTQDPVKAVLLAGGFGQNAYLRSQIQKTAGPGVEVLQINSRTAIARGALICGLARVAQQPGSASQSSFLGLSRNEDPGRIYQRVRFATVSSRPSPKHYGVAVFENYDETNELHWRGRSKVRPGQPGQSKQIEVVKWFVRKHEKMEEGKPKSFEMYYDKEAHGTRQPTIECRVYASEADAPPDFPDDPSLARPLLTLTIDLNDIPRSEWPTKEESGRTYYHVDFEIYVTLYSADIEFMLGRGDKRYKRQRVKYSRTYGDE
ncbi:hypothetical protein C8A03DRAFT_30383 [Achaetomium macrosporum]|uniref:Actin-like ATPase domain-containing protein n=1 Tax=Achaetomium macrosporum TaxID=79813 RepID=A0AAN7CG86_9PEZI|nr:hypothetical protein C8A03DRAFT_30383 [Achaetomium macrosporum]